MSRTVVGYERGKPIYRDDGPAYARVQGHGGSSIGFFTKTILAPVPRKPRADAEVVAKGRSAT